MRMMRFFSQTLREPPSDSEVSSHQLLLRAGFMRQLGAGIFSYLPLAQRSLARIMAIMREEIRILCQTNPDAIIALIEQQEARIGNCSA